MLDVLRIPYLRKRFILMSLIWCVPLSHIYFIDLPLTVMLGKVTRPPLHIWLQDLNQSRLLRPEPERRQFRHQHLHHAAGVRRRRSPRQPAEFHSQPAHREEADAVGLAVPRRRRQPLDPRHPQRYAGGARSCFQPAERHFKPSRFDIRKEKKAVCFIAAFIGLHWLPTINGACAFLGLCKIKARNLY